MLNYRSTLALWLKGACIGVAVMPKRSSLSPQVRHAAQVGIALNREFLTINHTIQSPAIEVFLQVAAYEGLSVGEHAAKLRMSSHRMSKLLSDLSDKNRRNGEGLSLVAKQPCLNNRRRKEVVLTDLGAALARRLTVIMNNGAEALKQIEGARRRPTPQASSDIPISG